MSENYTKIEVVQQKSNAPIICGTIGFVLSIPAILCSSICAGVCSGVTQAATLGTGEMERSGWEFFLPVAVYSLSWIAGFILSFFSKGNNSNKTGAFTIIAGVVMMIAGLIMGSILGIISGILYVVSGGCSISNKKKS